MVSVATPKPVSGLVSENEHGRSRVLQVITKLDMGGAEVVALDLVTALHGTIDFAVATALDVEPTPVGKAMRAQLADLAIPVFPGTLGHYKKGGAIVAACGSLPRRDAVPAAATSDAIVFGIPDARYYLDPSGLQALAREAEASVHREAAADPRSMQKPLSVLALSGGGDNGAFGAGVLVGWTAHGDRPNFKLVTGVSTGAHTISSASSASFISA